MSPEVQQITDILRGVPEITQAYVFGSVARGEAGPSGDLDVAVSGAHPLTADVRKALVERLAEATGRAIDLVELDTAGEPLLGEILREGIRLKGNDDQHASLMSRHIFDTEDFLPYVERLLKERRQRWTG